LNQSMSDCLQSLSKHAQVSFSLYSTKIGSLEMELERKTSNSETKKQIIF
jgi:hypothetical protein